MTDCIQKIVETVIDVTFIFQGIVQEEVTLRDAQGRCIVYPICFSKTCDQVVAYFEPLNPYTMGAVNIPAGPNQIGKICLRLKACDVRGVLADCPEFKHKDQTPEDNPLFNPEEECNSDNPMTLGTGHPFTSSACGLQGTSVNPFCPTNPANPANPLPTLDEILLTVFWPQAYNDECKTPVADPRTCIFKKLPETQSEADDPWAGICTSFSMTWRTKQAI